MKDVIEEGMVVELNGRFWGELYADGHSTSYGWGNIKQASMGDPRYCKGPESFTYEGSHYEEELKKGKLIKIKRITSYELA